MNRQTNMKEAQMQQRIEELEKKLAHYEDNCTIVWMIEDIEFVCREHDWNRPSKSEALDLLAYMERKHDASMGISWDTIYAHIAWDVREAEKKDLPWPRNMPDDYYENLKEGGWGDHPLNNREGVEYQ